MVMRAHTRTRTHAHTHTGASPGHELAEFQLVLAVIGPHDLQGLGLQRLSHKVVQLLVCLVGLCQRLHITQHSPFR